jgi:putative ABC transport system permease protein
MGPTIRALLKSKTGAILIILEIAITLAIVSNALSMISTRSAAMARSTGVDEDRLFGFKLSPIDRNTYPAEAAFAADRARLLALPGVENAYATDQLPLSGSGSSTSVGLGPDDPRESRTATYYADENTLATLGLKLISGRNFDAREIRMLKPREDDTPKIALISKALSDALFPDGKAVGKRLAGRDNIVAGGPEIIGVYARLQSPWNGDEYIENTLLMPFRPAGRAYWVVRAKPEAVAGLKILARETMAHADRSRVVSPNAQSMAQIRMDSYSDDRAMITLMSILSIFLIIITALGIVGMASFWVTQRTKQIGTRRALGASRGAIVRDFQVENALLTSAGAALGVALAYGTNYWFAKQANIPLLPVSYVLIGIATVFVLGQLAVLRPAQRASRVSPAIATRNV